MLELLGEYRDWLAASGASERTIEARVAGAKRLLTAAGTHNPTEITPGDVIRFIAAVPARASKATYHRHVVSLHKWAQSRGMHVTFLDGVPSPKARRGKPRPISLNELTAALIAADQRSGMMLRLAAFAGLRVSEIGRVRGEDVTDDTLYVVGKGDKAADVPLHPSISAHRDGFPDRGFWFPSRKGGPLGRTQVWRAMTQPLRRVGSEASPHQVRHFYGTSLLGVGGADLRTVQVLLRHEDLSSTQIYTQVTDEMRRRAIANLPDIA